MRISPFLRVLLLLVIFINLIECNSDIIVSADILVNERDVDYIGYSGTGEGRIRHNQASRSL